MTATTVTTLEGQANTTAPATATHRIQSRRWPRSVGGSAHSRASCRRPAKGSVRSWRELEAAARMTPVPPNQ